MKYGQIIKPEDVPGLFRSGDLRFGTLLEYRSTNPRTNEYEWSDPLPFYGFNPDNGTFISRGMFGYYAARFPLPDLKDGDPVVVRRQNNPADVWMNVFFHSFEDPFGDQKMLLRYYCNGIHPWTFIDEGKSLNIYTSLFSNWRLPTKKELQEAGLDGWYAGRIELEEEGG